MRVAAHGSVENWTVKDPCNVLQGNVEAIRSALHETVREHGVDPAAIDPWYYPSEREHAEALRAAGFTVDLVELIARPTTLPGDIAEWLETFAQPFIHAVDRPQRPALLREVARKLKPRLSDSTGRWVADYVRLRFRAIKSKS